MHLNTTTLNMATVLRRQVPDLILFRTKTNDHKFLAIRSLSSSKTSDVKKGSTNIKSNSNNNTRTQLIITRKANTSSGFYAPSTMTVNRSCAKDNLQIGNLNVFEDSEHLPSLSIPPLNLTLEKLKESISPVAMNSAEFVNTLKLIDKFARTAGPKLDSILREKASKTKNWLTHDWWVQEAYLKSRRPLVINSNPSMIYPEMPFEVKNQRALVNVISHLVSGIIDFKLALIHGYNPEATSSTNEYRLDGNLCYNQYKYIYGGIRMPSEKNDVIETSQTRIQTEEDTTSSNDTFSIVISFKGKFFEIQLKDFEDEKGRIVKIGDILEKILASETIKTKEGEEDNSTALTGAGVLTTARRDEWAKAIRLLDTDSIDAIRKCQFVVCIDTIKSQHTSETQTTTTETSTNELFSSSLLTTPIGSEQHFAALGRQVLHSDNANVGNRWFDKGIQLIVVSDENAEQLLGAGINYEHSFAEGVVITKMLEYSYDKTVQKHRESIQNTNNFFSQQQVFNHEPAIFRQLRMFDDSKLDEIVKYLKQAKQDFASQVDQFDLSYLNYKSYGSNSIKSWHFSPDSWFQTALLSAYFNVHKRLGPCYESAGTRRFAYGRTETIRSLTKEVAQFCFEPRFETMQAAIKSHKAYSLASGNGEAIDRALLGYRKTFDELKRNEWSWGLPPSASSHDELMRSKLSDNKNSGDEYNGKQNFNIESLFTENELNLISAFFNNELIKRSNTFALSTSQVSSIHPNIYMCYGPILADGYGCCYNITGQQIVAAITANSSNQSFSCEVEKLHEGVENSLNTMREIVEQHRCKQ